MKKKKTNCYQELPPANINECSNYNHLRVKSVLMDDEGNCYDQNKNYIGKGTFVDGRLQITQSIIPTSSTSQ